MDERRKRSLTGTPLAPLEKQVYQVLKKLRRHLENRKVIVAVSGGLDSVALLHILHALSGRFKIKLHVIHVNHGIRGKDADSDAEFVRGLTRSMKIPMTLVKLRKLNPGASENLMRQKRYLALFANKARIGAEFIAIAHHRDDLLETRLMRLLQGTGILGLRAMTLLSPDGLLRPLLGIHRREIEQYAVQKQFRWRNDATNLDTTKLRNWIRRQWLGVLRAEHPEYVDNLSESLERIVERNFAPQSPLADELQREPAKEFNRRVVIQGDTDYNTDQMIYNYLRHHAKNRVVSRHIAEFKKQLRSPRKQFRFRLAGVDWVVVKNQVTPDPGKD
jgi:tRNA(Ile)-lysidine synthase